MEEDTGKSLHVGGATGRIHGADYSLVDYNRAGIPLIEIVTKPIDGHRRAGARGRQGLRRARCATCSRRSASPTCGWSRARCAATSTSRWRRKGAGDARHPHRDQERQLAALGRAGGALRDAAAGRGARPPAARSCRRPGTGTRTPASPRRGREKSDAEDYRYFPEPDLVPVAPSREWVEELRGTLPEPPRERRARLQADWGFTDLEMRDVVNAGALDLVEETVAAGADAGRPPASGGSASSPAAPTTPASSSPTSASPRPTWPQVQALVDDGRAQRQAGPPGLRGRARRRGHARRGRRRARARGRLRRRRARRRRRRRASPPTPTSPTRSATARSPAAGCAHRRGHEGDAGPGRRRRGPRADPGEARPVLTARHNFLARSRDLHLRTHRWGAKVKVPA